MNVPAATPLSTNLRLALNVLVGCLAGFVIVREGVHPHDASLVAIGLATVFLATYVIGGRRLPKARRNQRLGAAVWLALLTAETLALVWISPFAAYLVFPIFFLYLHLIPKWWGAAAAGACALATIAIIAIAGRLTTGGVIGPLVGAFVAIAIGLGYRALFSESQKRQQLIDELVATRRVLAETEREAGILSERARLAREIHDTVAQGLSSIQLLLHAVERADERHPAIEHIRLARQTAAFNLDETRRFIQALTPAALEKQTLPAALERLGQSAARSNAHLDASDAKRDGRLSVVFQLSGDAIALPMTIETALLRIAQGALANVVQHAEARRATIPLTYMENSVSLDVVDDGKGFDPSKVTRRSIDGARQSFGLVAMRERAEQLGGEITVESAPDTGTAVAATFGLAP